MEKFTQDDKELAEYAIDDCVNFINFLFDNGYIPHSAVEWGYNTKSNAKNTSDLIKEKEVK